MGLLHGTGTDEPLAIFELPVQKTLLAPSIRDLEKIFVCLTTLVSLIIAEVECPHLSVHVVCDTEEEVLAQHV